MKQIKRGKRRDVLPKACFNIDSPNYKVFELEEIEELLDKAKVEGATHFELSFEIDTYEHEVDAMVFDFFKERMETDEEYTTRVERVRANEAKNKDLQLKREEKIAEQEKHKLKELAHKYGFVLTKD